jgi:hypothetical protein
MARKANTYYVVMIRNLKTGKLYCIGREGSYSDGAELVYGFKTRGHADRFSEKKRQTKECGVYSIQGQSFNGLKTEWDHYQLSLEAERQFNFREPLV